MIQQYGTNHIGQGDVSVVKSFHGGQQDLTSVNGMDTERPVLENGEPGQVPPGSNSEEGADMEEDKTGQNGDAQVENHGEHKTDSKVLADGGEDLSVNMEE